MTTDSDRGTLPKSNNPQLEPSFYCQLCGRTFHIEHMGQWQPYKHGPQLDVCHQCLKELVLPHLEPYPNKSGPVRDRAKADDVDGMVFLMARFLAEAEHPQATINEFINEGVELIHGHSTLERWFTKGGVLRRQKLSEDFSLYLEVQ